MMDPSEMAATLAGFANALGMIAAPRLHTKFDVPEVLRWTAENGRALLAEPLNFTANGKSMDRFRSELEALSIMLEASPDAITGELIAQARACFAAFGAGEPPEGWDQFTGERSDQDDAYVVPEPETKWREVERLAAGPILVVQGCAVCFIDPSQDAPSKTMLELFSDGRCSNSEIGLSPDRTTVIMTDRRRFHAISRDGSTAVLANLDEFSGVNADLLSAIELNWRVIAGTGTLYANALAGHRGGTHIAELNLADKTLRLLECWLDVEIDPERAVAYLFPRHGDETVIRESSFNGIVHRTFQTSQRYARLRLSPGRTQLLMSGNIKTLAPTPIGLLDLSTGKETTLEIEGAHAVWQSEDAFVFVRGENELWRFRLIDRGAECLFRVDTERTRTDSSYATAPTISASGRYLAWGCCAGTNRRPSLFTVLADLDQGEYRRLDDWWHNVQWLE